MKKASRKSSDRKAADEETADSRRLDGNGAAGILSELFVPDLTAARAKCAGCNVTQAIGALFVYAHGMGMVGAAKHGSGFCEVRMGSPHKSIMLNNQQTRNIIAMRAVAQQTVSPRVAGALRAMLVNVDTLRLSL